MTPTVAASGRIGARWLRSRSQTRGAPHPMHTFPWDTCRMRSPRSHPPTYPQRIVSMHLTNSRISYTMFLIYDIFSPTHASSEEHGHRPCDLLLDYSDGQDQFFSTGDTIGFRRWMREREELVKTTNFFSKRSVAISDQPRMGGGAARHVHSQFG